MLVHHGYQIEQSNPYRQTANQQHREEKHTNPDMYTKQTNEEKQW